MGTTEMSYRAAKNLEALKSVVGRRVLVRTGSALLVGGSPTEGRVREIAPSGSFVRMEWVSGDNYWLDVEAVELVEALPDVVAPTPEGERDHAE